MLVRIQDRAGTEAERVVVDWMRAWVGSDAPRGVATVNVELSARGNPQRFDILVWTPTGVLVLEIEGYDQSWDGELTVPRNGSWTIDERVLSFADTGAGRSPVDACRDHTSALQHWFADNSLGQRAVRGVVLLVPFGLNRLRVTIPWEDPNLSVFLGDTENRLRDYLLQTHVHRSEKWSMNELAEAFHAMDLDAQLPSPLELSKEGFSGTPDLSLWERATGALAAPIAPILNQLNPPWADDYERPPYSPWALYPKVPGETNFGTAFLRITLALGMLVVVAWFIWLVLSLMIAVV